ncbi:MAG: sulfurtransferase complex subunit TusC [Deltaproteobacteria bacterium]|nr:sulfurtransferase complex subunit TusC [Deltaproteobacteria bacterium]MBT4266669.1 sulfurtransferase complex subunit TusC [Deltaproteobacteria bacterium]MBT4644712.1 sulfurtransferase complex subunit TusC [Deltaproteobacteria bacterium]MBT6504707.1 sulfurtransferase complex subunit TusC [Deltaproteobacteria bacterium]MBT6612286.1 sulfurtransferase complex subunit TusC [Deltaproteobacteria bacterium]
MYVMRRAPHGTIYTYEGLEMVLITAAYEQDISIAFIDDGVYSLIKDQDTEDLQIKGFVKTFKALEDYEVEKLYVDHHSLTERGLKTSDLIVDVEVLGSTEIGKIMEEQDVIIHC